MILFLFWLIIFFFYDAQYIFTICWTEDFCKVMFHESLPVSVDWNLNNTESIQFFGWEVFLTLPAWKNKSLYWMRIILKRNIR